LALFTGGLLETKDYLGETVPVVMPPGYDPSKPLVVNNKGYGPKNNRGDLYVHVEPVFKDPSKLTTSDKTLLTRLYEQVNR
jgi:DnaJ-class molecular chaperone